MFFYSLQMSSSEESVDEVDFPFPIPLVRPPMNASLDELTAWVEARKPYVRLFGKKDWHRGQVNDKNSYARRSKDPVTGMAVKAKNALRTKVI